VLDRIAATAEEVAGAAVLSHGAPNRLGDLVPFRCKVGFAVALEQLSLLLARIFRVRNIRCGVSGTGREFLVGSCPFVANQTVYLFL